MLGLRKHHDILDVGNGIDFHSVYSIQCTKHEWIYFVCTKTEKLMKIFNEQRYDIRPDNLPSPMPADSFVFFLFFCKRHLFERTS